MAKKENAPEETGKQSANNPAPAAPPKPAAPPRAGRPAVMGAKERADRAAVNAERDARTRGEIAAAAEKTQIAAGSVSRTHAEAIAEKLATGKPKTEDQAKLAERLRKELGNSPAWANGVACDMDSDECAQALAGEGRDGLQAALAKIRNARGERLRQQKDAERKEKLRAMKPRTAKGG